MRNLLDFSSWSTVFSTLLSLVLVSLVAVGIRLVFMQTIQRRRERENRQINERLKTLIAAYKTLGGSFTGNLEVDPSHRRDERLRAQAVAAGDADDGAGLSESAAERRRRIRDAVEAALSDVILLGTQAQVELAVQAANEMVAGRTVHVAPLVASLRDFIREALDLDPVPAGLAIPAQGPLRTAGAGGGGGARRGAGAQDGGAGGGKGGGGQGGGMGAAGMGMGVGAAGLHHAAGDAAEGAADRAV